MRTVFGWPIYSDASVTYTPTFSNGTWSSALPLTNLQYRTPSKVARSSAATTASAKLDCDLLTTRAIGVVALVNHNFSSAALVRVRGASDSGFAAVVYDSGWVAGWPSGVTAEDLNGLRPAFWLAPSSTQSARYWRVEIDDTANTAGYLEIGRLIIAGRYESGQRPMTNAALGIEDGSSSHPTDSGAATIVDRRPSRRVAKFGFSDITESEAFASAWKMQRQLGTSGQVFFVWDADETTYAYEHAFLAVLRNLSALDWAQAAYLSAAYELVEEL